MSWIKQKIMSYVIGGLFESKYGKLLFGWANGHKTQIGLWLGFIGAVISILPTYFPMPYMADINANYILISGYILSLLGIEHIEIKKLK